MRANPTVIGAFVVGAIVLGVAGVLLFGSGEYFATKRRYVMFFEDSVDGLVPGSPMKLQGVKVGEVVDVHVEWDPESASFRIPVTVETVAGRARRVGGGELVLTGSESEKEVQRLIDKGLRASLATESFITGQLAITLEFHPDTPVRLVGGDLPYPEVPTVRSGLSKVMQEFQEIPFKQIFLDAQKLIRDIDGRVQSEDLTRAIQSVPDTLDEYRQLGAELKEKVGPLVDNIEGTSSQARETLSQAKTTIAELGDDAGRLTKSLDAALDRVRQLVDDMDAEVKPTAEDLRETMKTLRATLARIEGAAERVDLLLRDDSPTVTDLKRALTEFADAARAIKSLAATLERQPESLLRGKKGD